MTSKPVAVLISDIHFNVNTVPLASEALRQALLKATKLKVPLVIAGDLNDTKAIMRAECVNAIISILEDATVPVYILVGNHDLINEKSKEHSLNFLKPYATVVQAPVFVPELDSHLIPYQASNVELQSILDGIPKGSRLIMHQGVRGAFMGEYAVDKSSIEPDALSDYRVISGHYHRAQDIKTGRPRKGAVGLFSYIGTPYSITFAEAEDGPKGFRVLRDDGILDFVPTNLRKHVKVEVDVEGLDIYIHTAAHPNPTDLLWLKVSGPASELDKLNKKEIGLKLLGHQNFKLDKIYDKVELLSEAEAKTFTDAELLDKIIDDSEETKTQKTYLKKLWREIL